MLKNIIITTMLLFVSICAFATAIDFPFSSIASNKATILTNADLASYINQNKNSVDGELNGNFVRHGSADVPDEFIFEGSFTPKVEGVQLALFSDDGVTVWTRLHSSANWGNPIFSLHGTGQALPNLNQSLQFVTGAWLKDSTYDIKIEYSNISHPTWADIDGITAYFYNGTVEIPVVPKDPIPTSIILSVDDESKNILYQGGTKDVVIHSILDIDGAGEFTKDFTIDIYNAAGDIVATKNVAYETNKLNYLNDFTVTLPDANATYSYYAKVTYQYFDTYACITATDFITSNTLDIKYYDVLIQVRPKRTDGTGAWSDFASICSGGIDSNAHKAEIKIITNPSVLYKKVDIEFSEVSYINNQGSINIPSFITNNDGLIYGEIISSDVIQSFKMKSGLNICTVKFDLDVDNYDKIWIDNVITSDSSYCDQISLTHHGEPLTGHIIKFEIISISAIFDDIIDLSDYSLYADYLNPISVVDTQGVAINDISIYLPDNLFRILRYAEDESVFTQDYIYETSNNSNIDYNNPFEIDTNQSVLKPASSETGPLNKDIRFKRVDANNDNDNNDNTNNTNGNTIGKKLYNNFIFIPDSIMKKQYFNCKNNNIIVNSSAYSGNYENSGFVSPGQVITFNPLILDIDQYSFNGQKWFDTSFDGRFGTYDIQISLKNAYVLVNGNKSTTFICNKKTFVKAKFTNNQLVYGSADNSKIHVDENWNGIDPVEITVKVIDNQLPPVNVCINNSQSIKDNDTIVTFKYKKNTKIPTKLVINGQDIPYYTNDNSKAHNFVFMLDQQNKELNSISYRYKAVGQNIDDNFEGVVVDETLDRDIIGNIPVEVLTEYCLFVMKVNGLSNYIYKNPVTQDIYELYNNNWIVWDNDIAFQRFKDYIYNDNSQIEFNSSVPINANNEIYDSNSNYFYKYYYDYYLYSNETVSLTISMKQKWLTRYNNADVVLANNTLTCGLSFDYTDNNRQVKFLIKKEEF